MFPEGNTVSETVEGEKELNCNICDKGVENNFKITELLDICHKYILIEKRI